MEKYFELITILIYVKSTYATHATSTFPIMHVVPSPPPLPPKFCITFVFHFSWALEPSQEKLKTMLMQSWEAWEIRCIMGNVEV